MADRRGYWHLFIYVVNPNGRCLGPFKNGPQRSVMLSRIQEWPPLGRPLEHQGYIERAWIRPRLELKICVIYSIGRNNCKDSSALLAIAGVLTLSALFGANRSRLIVKVVLAMAVHTFTFITQANFRQLIDDLRHARCNPLHRMTYSCSIMRLVSRIMRSEFKSRA